MSNGVVFENDRYIVTVDDFTAPMRNNGCDYTRGYVITNKATGVVELQLVQLPEAIAAAEQLDVALLKEPWSYVREGIEAEVSPSGDIITMPGTDDVQ